MSVKIVNIESLQELPDGQEGEIWVSSHSKADGYYGDEKKTEETFNARLHPEDTVTYLRTGDLGYFESGDLFISGRLKDMIILAGRNIYHVEIEDSVASADRTAVRPGCVAAFALDDGVSEEKLCIVFEIRTKFESNVEKIISEVWQVVGRDTGVSPYHVVAIKQNTIPKTTSGKIRRHVAQQMLKMKHLNVIGERRADLGAMAAASDPNKGVIHEWKASRVERQEQIFQLIHAELLSIIPQSGTDTESLEKRMEHTSVIQIGLDSILLERLQRQISDRIGLTTPLSTGVLLDDSSFRALSIKVEEIRFPQIRDEQEDKAEGGAEGIKQANLSRARKNEENEMCRMLREAMPVETMPSRYDYCTQLPMYPEKQVPIALIIVFNFMIYALCIVMTVSSLCVASVPIIWAKNTLKSNAMVFAILPVSYVVFLLAAILWLRFIRVNLTAEVQEGRYPIHGALCIIPYHFCLLPHGFVHSGRTHVKCWAMGTCIVNFQVAFAPFAGTFMYAWLYRALGSRIGDHAVIDTYPVFSSFMLTVSHGGRRQLYTLYIFVHLVFIIVTATYLPSQLHTKVFYRCSVTISYLPCWFYHQCILDPILW